MKMGHNRLEGRLSERLTTGGFRFTPQRQQVYDVLLQKRDHPTAEEVFIRCKREMPDISMATVYNCLDALVRCGLVRQVQLERKRRRGLAAERRPEYGSISFCDFDPGCGNRLVERAQSPAMDGFVDHPWTRTWIII